MPTHLFLAGLLCVAFGSGLDAQEVGFGISPSCIACSAKDSGGADLVRQCFRGTEGSLWLFHKGKFLEASPAPRRFHQFVTDACVAMDLSKEDCNILPMVVDIGDNAVAGECDGLKVVFFDAGIDEIFGETGSMFVILHELGHHYCEHVGRMCSSDNELEADAFGGAGLRKLGVPLNDVLEVSPALGDYDGGVHPSVKERAKAMTGGWTEPELVKNCGKSHRSNDETWFHFGHTIAPRVTAHSAN